MDDEVARLREQLARAEDRIVEEQRRREEEQRRRENAELLARSSQPQDLTNYLEACHQLHQAIDVVTDRSLTTQGDTTNPSGRIYPRRIVPWDAFAARQEETWNQLASSPSLSSKCLFPSPHQIEYVMSLISPISSEIGLRNFERDTVENAVQKLVDEAYKDPVLRNTLSLRGTVTFESHTNLGQDDTALSESFEQLSTSADSSRSTASRSKSLKRQPRRKARGKGHLADQFCIYRPDDGRNMPTLAIEYKAPHKLSQEELVTGLRSEIRPAQDIINKDGRGFEFASKSLAAAVITQLFSYMIDKGIQYGYVCTGEAFVFLHIPDDPSIVYYSVCLPCLDVMDGDENRLHRTAVAQVFSFIIQALRVEPPPMSWHDAAAQLDTWAVEYEDVLSKIPISDRKGPRSRDHTYKARPWPGFYRSPIKTRSGCKPTSQEGGRRQDDDDNRDPPSPSPNRPALLAQKPSGTSAARSREKQGRQGREKARHDEPVQTSIKNRPYCTHQCLLGLASAGPIDKNCPNANDHGERHIARSKFLSLLHSQLARDRGPDADCVPLYISGSLGSLFKVRLSSYGYTLVAKGMESADRLRLCHEKKIYDQIRDIQGKFTPVCLGLLDLALPQYCDGGVYKHLMLLSWGGRPLLGCVDQVDKQTVIAGVASAFAALHRLGVLHRDAEARNILFDAPTGRVMVVDFERAEFRGREPLACLTAQSQNRKRKRKASKKQVSDEFGREFQSVMGSLSKIVESAA
ncbi:serine/threonine protein kinase [Apiospora arundinis]|uniref:Serine/threonine protein kinase n=1 Tax=Apiospora arundinis TaxID=335852 RepID=A0ABR2J403_9PEZI